ncbi:MAG: hypothetical protein AMS24_01195 [Chlamydiae bacterium SM23_39]|nr:MAG: hypothetical protein AMS24_01195 [Chlamydiae bacterium SM23_39]
MIDPYKIIRKRRVTEKASMLEGLKDSEKNRCIRKFKKGKYIFVVDVKANKREIKKAVEVIYEVKVEDVNTLLVKPKKRFFRGTRGTTKKFKKAIVTLKEGNILEEGK